MVNTKYVYSVDSNGYYKGKTLAQIVDNQVLMPSDCTEVKPTITEGYFNKWNGTSWELEKIPTTIEELILVGKLKHTDNSERALILKALAQKLVTSDSGYSLLRDDNLDYYIEKQKELTQAELETEQAKQELQEQNQLIEELRNALVLAQLANDTEQIAYLQATYQEIIG